MNSILVTPRGYARYGSEARKILESQGYHMDINDTGKPLSREVFEEKAKKSVGMIVGVEECNEELLKECKDLKAIVKFGVGTDNIDLDACKKLGIKVGRCVGTNSNAVAEYTIGMMFNCSRYLSSNSISVKKGSWDKPTGLELTGKNIGVIGFGNIGKQVARMANGIGMVVHAYDLFEIPDEILKKYGATQTSIENILKTCDYISIHVPLTDETKDMISSEQFKMMKNTAILVNASRGGIVNELDLYNALKNNEIFACASDVFTTEPPKQEGWIKELIAMDNFVLTAHIGSRSKESEINTVNEATRVINDLLK